MILNLRKISTLDSTSSSFKPKKLVRLPDDIIGYEEDWK